MEIQGIPCPSRPRLGDDGSERWGWCFASRRHAAGSVHAMVQSHRQLGSTPGQAPAELPARHQAASLCFVTGMSSNAFWRNGPVVGKGSSELADLS